MKKCLLLIAVFVISIGCFSACWDNRELSTIFLVTGIAIDLSDNGGYELTVQIVNPSMSNTQGQMSTGQSGQQPYINVSQEGNSIFDAYSKLVLNVSRVLILDHSHVLIFGQDAAEQGIKEQLDTFLRMQDARLEMPVLITEGKAKDLLNLKIEQDKLPSDFIYSASQLFGKKSKLSIVRIIDIINKFLDDHHGLPVPICKINENEGKQEIEFTGLAVLKDGKMVGDLDVDESLGYYFTDKKMMGFALKVNTDEGLASFYINEMKCKPKLTLNGDQITYTFNINANLEIEEMQGFSNYEAIELIDYFKTLAEDEIIARITSAIQVSKDLNVDIFNICCALKRSNYKYWKAHIDDWDNIYQTITFTINPNVKIPKTGDIIQSMELKQLENAQEMKNG